MRWVVVGSGGQLGAEFLDLMSHQAVGIPREKADLARPEGLEHSLLDHNPDGIINCAAFNHVDKAEDMPWEAFATNTWGVRDLAAICAKYGWKLVQFSTDHVFSGSRKTPWVETDTAIPVNAYGLSKFSGEEWARRVNSNCYVIRTCGLYGNKGKGGKGGNFVSTIRRLAQSGKAIKVVSDQVCNPSSARDVAKATIQLVARFDPGVYHLANAGICSWHAFASAVLELTGFSVPIQPISSIEFGSRARRPVYSALGSIWQGNPQYPVMRPWRESLAEYLSIV